MAYKNGSGDKDEKNIIDLATFRKQQRTLARAKRRQEKAKSGKPTGFTGTIWGYLQFFLFLAVLAYMMQLCRGGGI